MLTAPTADVIDTDRTEVSRYLIVIVVVTNLCTAGIGLEFGGSILSINSYSFPGIQVVLVLVIALGIGMTAYVLDQLNLGLDLLPSDRSCFMTPGSIFIFMDCQFFLVLLSLALTFDSLQLVQWVETSDKLTEVSG